MIERHTLAGAKYIDGGGLGIRHVVECSCGVTFERPRLGDAAVALERHQHRPGGAYDDSGQCSYAMDGVGRCVLVKGHKPISGFGHSFNVAADHEGQQIWEGGRS